MASLGGVANFFEDPAGYITGANKGGFTGAKNFLSGNPDQIKAAYDQMMGTARQMTGDTRNFLAGQEGRALQFYGPLQHMFNSAYGSEGIRAPQTPQVPGSTPLAAMYGGK